MEPEMNGANENPALPRPLRWTQQETFVLIDAKKIAEEKRLKGRRSSSAFGSDQIERKWDFISSHCRQQGMNKSSDQCCKKWGNLAGNFKKIKKWESQVKGELESYWVMTSASRRMLKLPGCFDREIYEVLETSQLVRVTCQDESYGDGLDGLEAEDVDEMVDDDDGVGDDLFPEFEQAAQERSPGEENPPEGTIPSPAEMRYQPFHQTYSNQENERESGSEFWRRSEVKKRRGQSSSSNCEDSDVGERLIIALGRNPTSLVNNQLDREQQKELHESLVKALAKVTEDVEKLAYKCKKP
ncbi:hypothetical protein ACJIZ3_004383 [Penstemon smallii]|uniref:Myb-like domain-containing protein n=1 Tax=Penstemon smallii TaxID=265156 RepID=A0ABD3S1Y3_9LAMI